MFHESLLDNLTIADESSNCNSNTMVTMIFLPGNHLLNITISFINIRQITMISLQVGNSSNVVVTCQRYGLFNYSFFISIWNSVNVDIRLTQQRKLLLKVVFFKITPKQSYSCLILSWLFPQVLSLQIQ